MLTSFHTLLTAASGVGMLKATQVTWECILKSKLILIAIYWDVKYTEYQPHSSITIQHKQVYLDVQSRLNLCCETTVIRLLTVKQKIKFLPGVWCVKS